MWMDEYAEFLYIRQPRLRSIDPGNLTDQKAIRTKLNCKPFKWFMTEVAFDLPEYYPPVEPPNTASGEVSYHVKILQLFIIVYGAIFYKDIQEGCHDSH